jgi:mannose/fructose/N-acetylgalactosamine-specific phosphotransferase system component IIC
LTKAIAVHHPTITSIVVIITGHHFLADGMIGATVSCATLGALSWAGVVPPTTTYCSLCHRIQKETSDATC